MSGALTVNSKLRPLPKGGTALALLQEMGLAPEWTIVELNGRVVPRDRLAGTGVAPGDRVEILQAVAGG